MNVWIDQDICTGDGLCEETCPSVFSLRDGIAFVHHPGYAPSYAGGAGDLVPIAGTLLDLVLNAAEDCPGECIFIEA